MTDKSVPLFPKGYSKEAQRRIEQALVKKAQKQAESIPNLPPNLAVQISNAIQLGIQGKFSSIEVGLATPNGVASIRILVFLDNVKQAPKQDVTDPLVAVPGSAVPSPELVAAGTVPDMNGPVTDIPPGITPEKEYDVGTTEEAKGETGLPPSAVGDMDAGEAMWRKENPEPPPPNGRIDENGSFVPVEEAGKGA